MPAAHIPIISKMQFIIHICSVHVLGSCNWNPSMGRIGLFSFEFSHAVLFTSWSYIARYHLIPHLYKSYEYYKLMIFSEDIIHKPAKPRMWETTLFSIVIMIVSWLESLLHWSEAWLSHLSLWIWINLSSMAISQGLTPPSFSIFTQEFTCTIPYFTLRTCLNHYMENLSNPILNFYLKVFLNFFLFSFFKL